MLAAVPYRENGRMRPGNQNKQRMRGRGRKGPNPLSRSYESNGPDVKIRGTALHVAEKYQQLARDAQASGDRIMSENYYQHAEHYLRIVAAAQPHAQPVAQSGRSESDDAGQEQQDGAQVAIPTTDMPERRERGGRPERGERVERVERSSDADGDMMTEDSPQPFIENMPVIDPAGQVNGHAAASPAHAAAEASAEDEAKPRRRARGTRTRSVKRVSSDEETATTVAVSEEAPAVAAPVVEEAPKPRRAPRARKPKPVVEKSDPDTLVTSD